MEASFVPARENSPQQQTPPVVQNEGQKRLLAPPNPAQMVARSPQVAQFQNNASIANGIVQRQAPTGGLPPQLKSGIESLSGIAMNDVRVHYNSSKPAQLQALAYAQGTDIHLATGQERHLPHEAWHVVQQKQGRVKPTLQLKGIAINDDSALEREADVMGARASSGPTTTANPIHRHLGLPLVQRKPIEAKKIIGNNADIKQILANTTLNVQYRYTLLLIHNADLEEKSPELLNPQVIPDITEEVISSRKGKDIKQSHYYRHIANPKILGAEHKLGIEADTDKVMRRLYESNGFVPLRDHYDDKDTESAFSMSKAAFDSAFEILKVEGRVKPKSDGLHLVVKNTGYELEQSIGESANLLEDKITKIEVFKKFNAMMDGLGIPVVLVGGAVASIGYDSLRQIKDLDYKTTAIRNPFPQESQTIARINTQLLQNFPNIPITPFDLNQENTHAIDAKIGGVPVTIARVMNEEDFKGYETKDNMISGLDLALDKAVTFMMRKKDVKKTTDLFDLLWMMQKLDLRVEPFMQGLAAKRNTNYQRRISMGSSDASAEAKLDPAVSASVVDQFSSDLVEFISRGRQSVHKMFLAHVGNKFAIKQIWPKLDEFALYFKINLDERGRPALLIQAGNMTGDMFGVCSALILNPLAHVVVIPEEKSNRDKSESIIAFYEQAIGANQQRVHVMSAQQNMTDAYTKYAGRTPVALPYSEIKPAIPNFLRSPQNQVPVSDATKQTKDYYGDSSSKLLKQKWGVDEKAAENGCNAYLTRKGIPKNQKYAVLWSRFSGKKGGPHAQHDTSFTGMRQMLEIAKAEGFIVLIAGDAPAKGEQRSKFSDMVVPGKVFDLIEFWSTPEWKQCFPNTKRSDQFAFFEYLHHTGGVQHLGFRSGNLEAYALLGQPVVYMEEKDNLQQGRMEAWHGGKINYNRIVINQLPSLTGRYIAANAAISQVEQKAPWLADRKRNKQEFIDTKKESRNRGFLVQDLHAIHQVFNPNADIQDTECIEGMRLAEIEAKEHGHIRNLPMSIQKLFPRMIKHHLENEIPLTPILKGIARELEEQVRTKLTMAAMMQGEEQEALTEALSRWWVFLE